MDLSVFNAYSRYYDLLYIDKDYASEAVYIQETLTRYGLDKGNLLEFGSGTGKHARLLVKRGYCVHGIERSTEMVARAKTVPGFSCEEGDICTVSMRRTYDAVISLFHVVSYQTKNAQLHAVFDRAAEHLEPGGLFIFDIWYSPAVYAQRPEVRVKRLEDEKVEIVRIAEPTVYSNDNLVDVHYTIYAHDLVGRKLEKITEKHPMRHFSLPEIKLLAEFSGFEYLMAEEFLTGKSPSEDTWSVCLVLRKA